MGRNACAWQEVAAGGDGRPASQDPMDGVETENCCAGIVVKSETGADGGKGGPWQVHVPLTKTSRLKVPSMGTFQCRLGSGGRKVIVPQLPLPGGLGSLGLIVPIQKGSDKLVCSFWCQQETLPPRPPPHAWGTRYRQATRLTSGSEERQGLVPESQKRSRWAVCRLRRKPVWPWAGIGYPAREQPR